MGKRSPFQRAIRAFFRLPAWARPAVVSGGIVSLILIPRILRALPELLSGDASTSESWLALAAGPGAGFLGGLIHGLSRPALRRLGTAGDYLSGIVILYAYLGALIAASPWVFERSAVPKDAQGWWIWLGMATLLGLVAGHVWFRGPEGFDRLMERRSQPQLQRLVSADGSSSAALVTGWIRASGVAELLERLAAATGARLPAGESARLVAALASLSGRDETQEDGLEWRLPLAPPILLHLVPEEHELVAVSVLLERENERHVDVVRAALAERTVDPLAA